MAGLGYVGLGGGGISAADFPVMDSVLDAGGWFQLSRFRRADPNRLVQVTRSK
jgi:hypothetical protein